MFDPARFTVAHFLYYPSHFSLNFYLILKISKSHTFYTILHISHIVYDPTHVTVSHYFYIILHTKKMPHTTISIGINAYVKPTQFLHEVTPSTVTTHSPTN